MTGGGDLLAEAVAALYSSDPDNFVERRGALAAQARAAGQAPVARKIAALRKPTRSAWVVNQLARAAPGAAAELLTLGDELRAAQKSLDGEAIRDLSLRRRQTIDALTRQAFLVSGQHAPAAALRDEVAATLGAALADPDVAEQLAAGTLERAARSEGFGPSGPPALTLVTGADTRRSQPAQSAGTSPPVPRPGRPGRRDGMARTRAATPATSAAPATVVTADQASAEGERRRQAVVSDAEEVLASASQLADAATASEQEHERSVQQLEEQLADARQRLAAARVQARRARARQRQARQALDRLHGTR